MRWGYELLRQGLHVSRASNGSPTYRWELSRTGKFTIASAYSLLHSLAGCSSIPLWRHIWQFCGPRRGSFLLWMAAHDRLKTGFFFWHRRILSSPACSLCSGPMEDTLHAVRDCSVAAQVWWLLGGQSLGPAFWQLHDAQQWINWNLDSPGTQRLSSPT